MKLKIDNMGRVLIPNNFRKDLNLTPGDFIEVEKTENAIYLHPVKHICCECNETENLKPVGTKFICLSCLKSKI